MEPEFHYCVHKGPLLVPFQSQMHPVHTFPPYLPLNQSNIIFSLMPSLPSGVPPRFSGQNFVCSSFIIYLNARTASRPLLRSLLTQNFNELILPHLEGNKQQNRYSMWGETWNKGTLCCCEQFL